jgi:hypothetical protein
MSTDVSYSVSDGVSTTDEHIVREGIALAERYIRDSFGGEIDDNLVVNVRDTQFGMQPGLLAFAGGDFLVVFTGSPVWQALPPVLRLQTVVHEYIHIYQGDRLGAGEDISPAWMVEGMAEYFSYRAVAELGIASMRDAQEHALWAIGVSREQVPNLIALESMEAFQASHDAPYEISQLAVERLLGADPEDRMRTYLDLVAGGASWRTAFPVAFDVKLDRFYRSFDAWIADVVAPRRPPVAFSLIEPARAEAKVVLDAISPTVERGDQVVVIGRTEPAVSCNFELRDGERNRVDRAPTFADQTGAVFWVATIPESMPAGAAFVVAACGGDTDRIEFDVTPGDPASRLGSRDG